MIVSKHLRILNVPEYYTGIALTGRLVTPRHASKSYTDRYTDKPLVHIAVIIVRGDDWRTSCILNILGQGVILVDRIVDLPGHSLSYGDSSDGSVPILVIESELCASQLSERN